MEEVRDPLKFRSGCRRTSHDRVISSVGNLPSNGTTGKLPTRTPYSPRDRLYHTRWILKNQDVFPNPLPCFPNPFPGLPGLLPLAPGPLSGFRIPIRVLHGKIPEGRAGPRGFCTDRYANSVNPVKGFCPTDAERLSLRMKRGGICTRHACSRQAPLGRIAVTAALCVTRLNRLMREQYDFPAWAPSDQLPTMTQALGR